MPYLLNETNVFTKIFVRIFVISFLVFPKMAGASNYYFSTTAGDDARDNLQAQNAGTPWKTLTRLNSFFSNLKAGDSVFFHRGEIFYGTINVKKSGTLSRPIVFDSYGPGNMAVISGLVSVYSWVSLGKGIYQSGCASCVTESKILMINGIPQTLGRYPNKGYLTYQSHIDNTSISDKNLEDFPNWTGADVVIKKRHWIVDRSNIISQIGKTLNYATGTSSAPRDNYGYFIENDPRTLDQFGEWYFDSSRKTMQVFFGNENPGSYDVVSSGENILVTIYGQRFIKFENLLFEGANSAAFRITNSKNITITYCGIDFSGTDGVAASGSPYLDIENSIINHSQNDAITLDSSCRSAALKTDLIKNTGLMPGMGKNGTGTYQAISAFGDSSLIECNEIDSTGYNAIYFGGNGTIARNNLIQYFCSAKDDGAGIYVGDWFPSSGKLIMGNIILNGVGSPEGTGTKYPVQVEGIYIDDNTANVSIESNSVANCPDAGIKIHNAHNVKIQSNTIFNNTIQLLFSHDNLSPEGKIRNVIARGNILFCKSAKQICMNLSTVDDDIGPIGLLDSNYYHQTGGDEKVIQMISKIWTPSSVTRNLALSDWQGTFKQDLNSKSDAKGVADAYFEYNFSATKKKVSLKGYNIQNNPMIKTDSFILMPYHSVLMIKD